MSQDLENLILPMGTTLDRFIMRHQAHFAYATGELSQLLRDIALASKIVNREINRAGLSNLSGAIGSQNVQGEEQQKLDVIANVRFIRALKNGGEVCAIISEEDEAMIDTGNWNGRYIVAIDPLDGSSNIDVNVAVGTIFSIYRRKTETGTKPTEADVMQKGTEQVAAGYILYGSSTMLVYTTGHGVNGFTYEPSLGEYYLSHPNIMIPTTGKIYSCNEGSYNQFSPAIQKYIEFCKSSKYSGRYIGSFVADFHRNLFKGGIFIYPCTTDAPKGKLRLLYECNPMAMLVEQAGGDATDGSRRIMTLEPKDLHERSPLFIGSEQMVAKVMRYIESETANIPQEEVVK